MGGLRKYLPVTFFTFLIGVLAISGIPPFAGFFSKDEILAHAFEHSPIIWALALFASLLTAFYMFRLLFLTFFGNERASHDVMHHIHESPKSITIPLMALAVLSLIGGFAGVPEVLGGSHWLGSYLAPVFAQSASLTEVHHLSHGTELGLMGTVVILTLMLIGIAYAMYVRKKQVPQVDANISGLQQVLYKKYYIDELYDAIIVKPLQIISSFINIFLERLGIDQIVNLFGSATVNGSKGLRLLQNGSIGFYIFMMVIGVILILTLSLFSESFF